MSLTIHDNTRTEIIYHPQTVYCIRCDGIEYCEGRPLMQCLKVISFHVEDGHLHEVYPIPGHGVLEYDPPFTMDDAIRIAKKFGWQEGTKGIMYCPKHREES